MNNKPAVIYRDLEEVLAYIREIYLGHESPTHRRLGFTITGQSWPVHASITLGE